MTTPPEWHPSPTPEADACRLCREPHATITAAVRSSGLSQTEIARAMCISPQALSSRVTGRTAWRLAELAILAQVLGLPLTDLLGLERTTTHTDPTEVTR